MAARASLLLLAVFISLHVRLIASKKLYIFNEKLSWYDAHAACVSKGHKGLTTIANQNEQNQLISRIRAEQGAQNYYWIGLSDLGEKGKYVWFTTGHPATYTKWADNEPQQRQGENCIALMNVNSNWGWNDDVCNEPKAGYICEA